MESAEMFSPLFLAGKTKGAQENVAAFPPGGEGSHVLLRALVLGCEKSGENISADSMPDSP